MKKSTDPDGKASGKSTAKDKSLRSRNKRKYKRKKSAKHHTKRAFEHSLREHGSHKAAPESDGFVHHRRRRVEARPVGVGPSCPQIKHAQNVWMKTYQNIVKWQYQHQLNYWKQHALLLREENVRLRRRLTVHDSEDEADEALAYAEAATWELQNGQEAVVAEDDEALDEEFIAFMEVSARHRLERRRLKNESVH
ncbi:AAEL007849-PA [Aedes aegypti]|uniref:AAEL007849-PA n=1 Tax=Aedes aegypti TaxID=7159 RepID=Q170P9_AEDAE|nr:AAEL007849-PA [Aedes aegypti]